MPKLTPDQQNKLQKVEKALVLNEIIKKEGGIAKIVFDIEDKIESAKEELGKKIEEVAKMEGPQGPVGESIVGEKGENGKDGKDGKDGRDGIDGKDGRDGIDGKDGKNGVDGKNGKDGKDGLDGSPDTAEDIRNKLEVLSGDERLAFGAIRESDDILKDLKELKERPIFTGENPVGMGGGSDVMVLEDGVPVAQGVHKINFGAGFDVTKSSNGVSIVVDATEVIQVDAAGNDTEVQFNDGGILGADSTFTFNKTTKELNANAFVTTGGTSSDFVKGDGSLDSTSYATDSEVFGSLTSGYLPYYDSVDFANSPVYTDGTNVGIGTTSTTGKLNINTGSASTIGQIIQGSASQTANLLEWQNSSGTVLGAIDELGNGYFGADYATPFTGTSRGIHIGGANNAVISLKGIKEWKLTSNSAGSFTFRNETDNSNIFEILAGSAGQMGIGMGSQFPSYSNPAKLNINNQHATGSQVEALLLTNNGAAHTSTETQQSFRLLDSGGSVTVALFKAGITDITDGASDGKFTIQTRVNDVLTDRIYAGDYGVTLSGDVGIGTTSPSAILHTLGTTEQLRIGYDASNYWNATTYFNGATDFEAYGSAPVFTFNQRGADVDFIIEGDTATTLFKTDAGLDAVSIGGNSATNTRFTVASGGTNRHLTEYGMKNSQTVNVTDVDETSEIHFNTLTETVISGSKKVNDVRSLNGSNVVYTNTNYTYGVTASNYFAPGSAKSHFRTFGVSTGIAVNDHTVTSYASSLEVTMPSVTSGTIANAYGLNLKGFTLSSTGSIGNYYGGIISPATITGAGTITNAYGLYISDFGATTAGTNRYALYTLGGNVVFNENGTDSDFRIEGDTDPNLFFIDGGNDRVGVGTTSPASKFHIVSRTEPLRIGYDVSNYYTTTVGTTGGVTFDAVGVGASFTFSDNVNINAQLYVTDGAYQTWLVDGASAGYFDDGVNYVRLANGSYAVETSGPVYIYTPSTEGLHIDGSLNYPSLHATNGGNGGNFSAVLVDENNYVGFGAGAGVFSDGTNTVLLSTGTYAIDATGDIKHSARIIRSKNVYTGTDTTTDVYHHICDSASAFTLTVSDGTDNGEEIRIINRGAGTVTLSGNISSVTATSTLLEGETITLVWDSGDGEWQ